MLFKPNLSSFLVTINIQITNLGKGLPALNGIMLSYIIARRILTAYFLPIFTIKNWA